ncbi:hypothetical protein [Oceanibacterium hippocampi]|uniref:Uncharacterized protein n=1 Tax=Oceanibacterium hippocampi TaxID=745714 RepID=A0A1Y5TZ93_9PROT|nr:hypothetical protein [Oceanibacterium hippocampi]SLN71891.1 hypothetical protein OCH7691_03410 [Oceanibacterium hippocampi]
MIRSGSGWRLPAPGIEATIVTLLTDFLGNPRELWDAVGAAPDRDHSASDAVAGLIARLTQGELAVRRTTFERIVRRIDLSETEISVSIDRGQLAALIGAPGPTSGEDAGYRIIRPMEKRRRGVERKIVLAGPAADAHPDPVLCRTIAIAHRWVAELADGTMASGDVIAKREQRDGSDVSRLLPLAFLAPDIVEAILDGRLPPEFTARSLRALRPIPADWTKRRALPGFPPAACASDHHRDMPLSGPRQGPPETSAVLARRPGERRRLSPGNGILRAEIPRTSAGSRLAVRGLTLLGN